MIRKKIIHLISCLFLSASLSPILINSAQAQTYILPDTGQIKCYDNSVQIPCPQPGEAFYGQDGNYEGLQPTYQLSPDGLMVTNLNTGLMWQQADDGVSRDWYQAVAYCEDLDLGGHSDWRLPSRMELVSIVDYGRYDPAINPVFSAQSSLYWSDSTEADDADFAWYVSFYYGDAYYGEYKSYTNYVRCVRGGPLLNGSFEDNGDGSVTNTSTGLVWQQADDGRERNWQEALSYCEDLELAGKTDWRLPNIRELQSIVDDGRYDPAIDPVFSAQSSHYWSGSTYANLEYSAWDVDFGYGLAYYAHKGGANYVRCVCGGPSGSFENSLIFPHIASNGTWETDICIINSSDSDTLSGALSAYSNSGRELLATSISLLPNARWEITVGDFFPNSSDIGYLIFWSNSTNVIGYTKFYVEGRYRVALPAAAYVSSSDIYIPHIASDANWWTGISLLNTTSSSKTLTIQFDNGVTSTIGIAAYEHRAFTVRDLFAGSMQPDIQSAVIRNASGIAGLELFGSTENSKNTYLSGILLDDKTTTAIYYPHIASDSVWWTGIVAYNPSLASCNLNITPFTDDGASLTPTTITLAGEKKFIGTARDLNFPAGTAWFKLDSTLPVTGFQLFGTNDGNQMGGYNCAGIGGTEGVFAKTDVWTGIAFVNVENASAAVMMTAYGDSGDIISEETLHLGPYEKVVGLPSRLFPWDISAATYIGYSSDRRIVGFQLNGSPDNMMLDALPGL
ncbi:MAG: DUF1566 domain-containing protein [Deltaproteobacteria bacterium]|nr:DUF1566 domain-containing protein [Deltaproteobacteria bacterium]